MLSVQSRQTARACPEQYTKEGNTMDSKLRAQVLTMAAATLGLSLVGGCAKKGAEPAQAGEAAQEAEGGEHSCGAAPAEGTQPAEGGGEHACGGGSCGAEK